MIKVAIQGYGAYIPKYRIKNEDIARVWGKNPLQVERSLGVREKSIASFDEDTVTMAYESSLGAFDRAGIKAEKIELCVVGSESHPYAVNPTSTIVAEFLGVGRKYLAADLEFACKAATAGLIMITGLVACQKISYGLVIGADTAQAKPHDILEYTAASAAASFIIGPKNSQSIAEILDFTSFSSDTPDFWRRDGVPFPSHGGRFTGEPAYFAHVEGAAKLLLEKSGLSPSSFAYCVFHMPNGKFPRDVAKRLGFSERQLKPSLVVDYIGNPYSASSLLGLSSVLDIAREDELIFMVSYGSGAGSDAFILRTCQGIKKKRNRAQLVSQYYSDSKYITYVDFLKFTKKI